LELKDEKVDSKQENKIDDGFILIKKRKGCRKFSLFF